MDRFAVNKVPLVAFSDYPPSYQNACIGVTFSETGIGAEYLAQYRALGAPLLMDIAQDRVQPWAMRCETVQRLGDPFPLCDIDKVFAQNSSDWGIAALGRTRRTEYKGVSVQPDFFDRGLLPMLQRQFQQRLRQQLEYSFAVVRDRYLSVHASEPNVAALFAFLFRFVTAKIFMDRGDVKGWDSLANDPLAILKAAEKHTGLLDKPESVFRRKSILEAAWESVSGSLQFHNLAAPDLAFVAESAFITPKTRKELGVHSTPAGLAEYIVEHLDWETIPWDQRVVFEPFSGHGILLAKAMERMGRDLPTHYTPAKRHEYFRHRLIGVEDQPLSLEICRLVLTLTDYPNGNSWVGLHCADVFQWPQWDKTLSNANVIVANPPYEAFDKAYRQTINPIKTKPPAEMIRRMMQRPPSLLGLVLPRSFVTDPVYRDANRDIARRYSDVRIVELPPIFRYAKNDTLALIAGGLRAGGPTVNINYSEVQAGNEEHFLEDFRTTNERESVVSVPSDKEQDNFSLRLLPKKTIATFLATPCLLGDVAQIHKGINWIKRADGKPQSAARTDVAYDCGAKERKGYHKGAEKMEGNLAQFQLRSLRMLSLRDEHQDPSTKANKRPWEKSKVALNAARFQPGSPWRLAPWADTEGLAFTKQFFCLWPDPDLSEHAIAAVLASPVANLYIFERDSGRDNRIETLLSLPLPPREFLKRDGILHSKAQELQALLEVQSEFFQHSTPPIEKQVLRATLDLDAAVLDAYALTAEQQHWLLDKFTDWARPLPPPFQQSFTGHFPVGHEQQNTLRQFILEEDAVNDSAWSELMNDERCSLIEKEFGYTLSPAEQSRLEWLQAQQAAWSKKYNTRKTDQLDAVLEELRGLPLDTDVTTMPLNGK